MRDAGAETEEIASLIQETFKYKYTHVFEGMIPTPTSAFILCLYLDMQNSHSHRERTRKRERERVYKYVCVRVPPQAIK